nr:MAG TPA: hypothetical protein [Caudoviricetes sp.]
MACQYVKSSILKKSLFTTYPKSAKLVFVKF